MPGTLNKEVSVNLDLLRAVAVVSVFLSHLGAALHYLSFGSLGRFGVILFFVHTSFVLMASMQRLEETGIGDGTLAIAFWIRRIFRIYPLSILTVVLMVVFAIPRDPGETYVWIGVKGFVSNLALCENLSLSKDILGVLWSLPLEVQMYVLLPFAFFAIRGRRYRSLALWMLSVLLAVTISRAFPPLNVFYYAPCFTSGIVAFDLIRGNTIKFKLPAWVWPLGIVAAIVLFGPHDNVDLHRKLVRAWVLSLFLAVLYAYTKEAQSNWCSRVFHWIAEHSYGIYLSHSIVLWFAFYKMAQLPLWTRIAVLVIGGIGVPALLYASIERPLIRVGSRVAERIAKRSRRPVVCA